MGPFIQCRFSCILLALSCAVTGCTGLNSLSYREDIDPQAASMLAKVGDLPVGDRIAGLEALILQYPDYVEAHRQLQNLCMQENRQGYLVNLYRKRFDEDPGKPLNSYLYGRLFSNPEHQLSLFSSATQQDPSFFWAQNGLGYAYMNAGDFKSSAAAYKKAIQSAPSKIEPYQGLISAYLTTGKLEEADKLLAIALERFPDAISLHLLHYRLLVEKESPAAGLNAMIEVPPELELGAEFFLLMLNLMDRGASDYDLKRVLYRFGVMADDDLRFNGALDLVLGACCMKLGNLNGARYHLNRVYLAHPENVRASKELRYLYTVTFRMREACSIEMADYPADWLEGSALRKSMPRLIELSKHVQDTVDSGSSEKEGYELASLLVQNGWLDEAMYFLYIFADPQSVWGLKSADLLNQLYRHSHFELTLRDFFVKQYQEFRRTGYELGWEQVLEQLGRISSRILGTDIFADPVVMDYTPVGILLDPRVGAGSGPAAYFRKFNRFFLLGRKMGGPVEACLLDICDYQPDKKGTVAGSELRFDLILCENLRIPSLVEYEGGNIVGAALSSFIFINLDMIRQKVYDGRRVHAAFKDKEAALLNDPTPLARNEEERLSTEEPWGLLTRLKYLSFKKESSLESMALYMTVRTDAVLCHEIQHLADAKRFLPVLHNLLWKFYHLTVLGFSAFNIESWLEERAQMYALLEARDSYAVLAEIVDYLGGNTFHSPYRKGYTLLMQRVIDHIHEHPDLTPSIDCSANILHQVHKLTHEEIRSIALAIATEEGLLSPIP
ncbi:MAG: tetratricopeptide repeat protein [Planctomycetota bacterium]